ncbi:DNA polymerase III subunit delta [Spirochaetia bacterium]|nr:DNA polymerase III subunit delta [Spirochaetia bacterium]
MTPAATSSKGSSPGLDLARGCCFLFLGPELGEKSDAVEGIRKSLRQGGAAASQGSAAEETSFYATETAVTDVAAALLNGSLFADIRLFFIKNAEVIKKKDEIELLASYMKSPQSGTVLILMSEETRLAKGLEDAVPAQNKRIFWELFEDRKTEWVRAFFRREGCRIEEDGVGAILELVENNTDALRRECGRLALFLGKDKPIEAADVDEWLSHTREESAFTLFSRIAGGGLSRCVESLHALLGAKEAPPAILAGLAWCFRKLRDYQYLVESGSPNDFEFKKIGLASPKARKDYAEAYRRYGPGAGDRLLALTAEYDIRLRSGGTALEEVLMEMFLYKAVCQR